MTTIVYFLCAVTSAFCSVALSREYRRRHTRLLLWSSLAFTGFALNNTMVFTDFVVLPGVDLSLIRACLACAAVSLLLFGLVWDAD